MLYPSRCRLPLVVVLQASIMLTGYAVAQTEISQPPAQPMGKSESIDFAKQINPLLTKSGCNAGACHGAAAGRGYLALSLFGSRPLADYEALLFAKPGRYIDTQDVISSLLIQKPCGYLEHGGGVRIDTDSDAFGLLTSWIESGAERGALAELDELIIAPGRTLVCNMGQSVKLSATSRWSDGDVRDATPWLLIEGADEVSDRETLSKTKEPDSLGVIYQYRQGVIELTPRSAGYWPLTIRFGSVAKTVQLWVAARREDVEVATGDKAASDKAAVDWGQLDALVADANDRLRQPLASPCAPQLLARRWWLDLMGRHPTVDEWQSAIADINRGQSAMVVDRLLASPEFVEHAADEMAGWVAQAGSASRPDDVDKLSTAIREFLQSHDNLQSLADGTLRVDSKPKDLARLHQFARDPRTRAELIASVWMGVRIGCAQCHDHPLDHWTQDDYFAMAACWSEIESDPARGARRIPARSTTDLRTGRAAIPSLPDSRDAYANELMAADVAFTQWLCSADNPYFSRNLANRIWLWLMGTGLVEDVDDHRATNPPINPELLHYLAQRLTDGDFSLRSLVREIVLSEAYRRSSVPSATTVSQRLLAARRPKEIRIPLEQLAAGALDVPTHVLDSNPQSSSMMMVEATDVGCTRGSSCTDPFAESLQMVAGARLQAIVQQAVADALAESGTEISLMEALAGLHGRIFGSEPNEPLRSRWEQWSQSTPVEQHQLLVEDILWSWLVSDAFRQLN